MTNPILVNTIKNSAVILWQYDKAYNLIKMIESWNTLSELEVRKFWDVFNDHILSIYPIYFGDESDEEIEMMRRIDTFALNLWGKMMGISRPTVNIVHDKKVTNKEISDDLYRRLLVGRFFLMNRRPTVENYNKYLGIVFPDKSDVRKDDGFLPVYRPRNKALDFGDMSMGFTFPENVTDEEAGLIFQHYDLVYRFPAGIRSNCSFRDISRIIGFEGQKLRNLAGEFAWAQDDSINGGIISSTEHGNYNTGHGISGSAYVARVSKGDSKTVKVDNKSSVWIDWGDGDNNARSGYTEYTHQYSEDGMFAIAVYCSNGNRVTNETEISSDIYTLR